MLHAYEIPKSIKNIWLASEITGVYIYKKWFYLGHENCQNILIYNFLLEHNWKDYSFEINCCVNYLQLNSLVYQNKTCFKNK